MLRSAHTPTKNRLFAWHWINKRYETKPEICLKGHKPKFRNP